MSAAPPPSHETVPQNGASVLPVVVAECWNPTDNPFSPGLRAALQPFLRTNSEKQIPCNLLPSGLLGPVTVQVSEPNK